MVRLGEGKELKQKYIYSQNRSGGEEIFFHPVCVSLRIAYVAISTKAILGVFLCPKSA